MKSKLIQVLFGLGALSIAVFIITGYVAECRAGDVCLEQKINVKREEKQAYLDRIAVIDEEIEAFKKQLTVGYTVEKLKSGDTKQVSKDILGFKANLHVVQQAYADTSDQGVTSSQDVSLSTEESKVTPLRYQAALTKIGSPYANVNIGGYCEVAMVTKDQCDILVAIANSESNSGLNFKSNFLSRDEAIALGQNFYFNPVGIKDLRPEGERERSHPDENGMYLRRFDSWDSFWLWYPGHMKEKYFDRGGTTPEIISKCYVRGDCLQVKPGWVGRVKDFISKI